MTAQPTPTNVKPLGRPLPHRREFVVPWCATHVASGTAFTYVYDPDQRVRFELYGLHLCTGGEVDADGNARPYTQLIYACGCRVDISAQLYGVTT